MVAHSLHRHSESLVNAFERVALHVVEEIMRRQCSPTGPTLGSHQAEASFFSKPPQPYSFSSPAPQSSPAYLMYKVGVALTNASSSTRHRR